jgi:hypothetical protein
MKKIQNILFLLTAALGSLTLGSCINDLNQTPLDKTQQFSDVVFTNQSLPYIEYLAKVYAGFATGGIQGGDSQVDISGYDGGSQAGYLRPLWNLQELPTDEAMCCWNDATIQNFHSFSWTPTDIFINGFYSRLYYQITIATAFLQETTADKLTARGVSQSLKDSINTFRSEARFLRALAYFNVLDLFRNGPLVTDASKLGSADLPPYATSQQLFDFIESELNDCQSGMLDAVVGFGNTYGHANKAAAWSLLARLYLNANTYLGTSDTKYYTSCITNCNKVIGAGYILEPIYQNLYVTDNYNSKEIIFPIVADGTNLTSWGGMMFLECSAVNGDIQSRTAAPGAWGGNRATQEFLNRFVNSENGYQLDDRYALLYTGFNHTSIDDNTLFNQGVQVLKYSNKSSAGVANTASFASTDFPLFRLGDIYLMYAEAVLRNGTGGTAAQALIYVNALRARAEQSSIASGFYTGTELNITSQQLTLDFILEERAREMFWEATRRTDLVRFGKLTDANYVWQWKGGLKIGKGVDSYRNVYPLPSSDLSANPNLKQNQGY